MNTLDRAKALLGKHGELRAQPLSDWRGSIALPDAVAAYYRDIGPVDLSIESYGNPYFFPSLANLWDFQAGYRWNGLNGERLTGWEEGWLVIGDEGGNPFIFSCESGRILLAEHGTGRWEPDDLFPDLTTMVSCLAAMGAIAVEAADGFANDDGYVLPRHLRAAKRALDDILGFKDEAATVLAALGWG